MAQSIDLVWIEDFVEVAHKGSISSAAKARGLSQSALSRRIKNLELWLGPDLFNRQSSRLTLTASGETFMKLATDIIMMLRNVQREVELVSGPRAIPLYTLHTLAVTFVPDMLRNIRKIARDVEFDIKASVRLGNISDCADAIVAGSVPFVVTYEDILEKLIPPGSERIERIQIARDRLIPVCGSEVYGIYKTLFEDGKSRLPYCTYSEGTFLGLLVKRKIDELDLEGRLTAVDDAQMADTLRNLARAGQGIAWVLHSTAQNALKNEIRLFDFGRGAASYADLEIVLYRATDYVSRTSERVAIERFWQAAESLTPELSPPTDELEFNC